MGDCGRKTYRRMLVITLVGPGLSTLFKSKIPGKGRGSVFLAVLVMDGEEFVTEFGGAGGDVGSRVGGEGEESREGEELHVENLVVFAW